MAGGAARGFAHLGVLRALQERDLEPDVFAGTSAGALMGALWASGWSVEDIREAAQGFAPFQLWRYTFTRPGLLDSRYFRHYWSRFLPETFEELDRPLRVVATDLSSGEPVVLDSGPLEPAIAASCAIPPLFEAVEVEGRWYFDGSLSMNLPTPPLRDDCQVVIASEVNPNLPARPEELTTTWSQFSRSLEIMFRNQSPPHRALADLIIEPAALHEISTLETQRFEEIERLGYEEAQRALDDHADLFRSHEKSRKEKKAEAAGPRLRAPLFPGLPDSQAMGRQSTQLTLAAGVMGLAGLAYWWGKKRGPA